MDPQPVTQALHDLHPRKPYFLHGAAYGVVGGLLLVVGTVLHPVPADVNDAAQAFASYAAVSRPSWVAAHLLPLAGITGMLLAMLLLARAVAADRISLLWARLTAAFGAAAVAVTATLQAVDGVALKAMVDLWASSTAADRSALFASAQAVRQIEIGLDGVFSLTLAATAAAFGMVLVRGTAAARVLAALAFFTAAAAAVSGVLFCLQGFSPAAMNAGMTSGGSGLILTTTAAIWAVRRTRPDRHASDARRTDTTTTNRVSDTAIPKMKG
jgi:hypothetical protein